MKKNFFKKLSFVLALAMIVSVLAPATGVFAKAAPKLNAKTKYLHLDVAKKNEFDFNIANKQSGWKYVWSSANEDVAEVNAKNGLVTATGVGKTKISVVISDKSGEEIDELTATVVVRDNIKDLTITNTPADNKLAVGVENDFNRSFTTVSGSTKKTSGITRWTVDKEGATIVADNGKFVATEAGKYTITARSFQSKAKYTSWLSDNEKYANYVTATATYEVTVEKSMVKAVQTTLKKFDVVFDSAVEKADVEKNLVVSYMAGTTKVKELIKGISMSSDNKTATVELYVDMQKGATYVVDYTGMKSVQFVSATTKPEDVVEMAILTTTAEIGKKKTIDIALYNKDKVDISGDANLMARVTFDKKDNNLVTVDGRDLYMYKVGETVNVTYIYHTYNWVDGKEVGNLTATGLITCVDQSKADVGTLNAYTVSATVPANFKDVKHTTFKGTTTNLYVELKGKDASGNDMYTNNKPGNTAGTWKYTTSDKNILAVGETTGTLYAVAEGTAVIVVYLNDKQVAACEVTVTGAQQAAFAALDTTSIVVSKTVNETVKVGLKVEDQLKNKYTNFTAEIKPNNDTTDARTLIGGASANATNGVTLYPYGVPSGTYYYTVTVTDGSNGSVKLSAPLSVTVQDPGTAEVTYYRVEPTKSIYDLKDDATIELAVYGYTAGGVKKEKVLNPAADLAGLEIKNSDGKNATVTWSGATGTINLKSAPSAKAVSGATINVIDFQATGTYTIKATSVSGSTAPVSISSFEVKNGREVVKVSANKKVAADGKNTVLAAINDCYDFAIGDKNYDVLYLAAATGDNYGVKYTQNGNDIYIEYLYIYEPEVVNGAETGNFFAHKVDMKNEFITLGK
jgi:hypothetical protein